MKRELRKSGDPQSQKEATGHGKTAVIFNPAQPLLSSARRSLQQPKHSLTRKSAQRGLFFNSV